MSSVDLLFCCSQSWQSFSYWRQISSLCNISMYAHGERLFGCELRKQSTYSIYSWLVFQHCELMWLFPYCAVLFCCLQKRIVFRVIYHLLRLTFKLWLQLSLQIHGVGATVADPAAGLGGARNMKSMWPPSATIFLITCFFLQGRGAIAPLAPLDPLLC